MNIREDIRQLREKQIRWALEKTNGSLRASAKCLGLNNVTLLRWMRELGLQEYAEQLRKKGKWWLVR